ncbi:hypothetical protein F5Y09DRAFT_34639 [Xylaria sp. FL1042]|nr:hypothetical protein F5Y09DRAFT_34639 [Xylaria sp. FL1042]
MTSVVAGLMYARMMGWVAADPSNLSPCPWMRRRPGKDEASDALSLLSDSFPFSFNLSLVSIALLCLLRTTCASVTTLLRAVSFSFLSQLATTFFHCPTGLAAYALLNHLHLRYRCNSILQVFFRFWSIPLTRLLFHDSRPPSHGRTDETYLLPPNLSISDIARSDSLGDSRYSYLHTTYSIPFDS